MRRRPAAPDDRRVPAALARLTTALAANGRGSRSRGFTREARGQLFVGRLERGTSVPALVRNLVAGRTDDDPQLGVLTSADSFRGSLGERRTPSPRPSGEADQRARASRAARSSSLACGISMRNGLMVVLVCSSLRKTGLKKPYASIILLSVSRLVRMPFLNSWLARPSPTWPARPGRPTALISPSRVSLVPFGIGSNR